MTSGAELRPVNRSSVPGAKYLATQKDSDDTSSRGDFSRTCSSSLGHSTKQTHKPQTRGLSGRSSIARWLVAAIVVQGGEEWRSYFDSKIRSDRLGHGQRAHDGFRGSRQEQGLRGPGLRNEFAQLSWHELSHWREFFQYPDAAGQPVSDSLVVPEDVHLARELQRQNHLDGFWWHQLPRQHFSERQANRRLRPHRRRLAHLRTQHY